MTPITTKPQLDQLMNSTMIYAVIVGLVAVVLSIIIAQLIPWEGGNDKSYIKRRIAYFFLGACAILGFWLYNDLAVVVDIKNPGFQNMFRACNFKCVFINLGTYFLISIILMFVFRHSKYGSILPKHFKK